MMPTRCTTASAPATSRWSAAWSSSEPCTTGSAGRSFSQPCRARSRTSRRTSCGPPRSAHTTWPPTCPVPPVTATSMSQYWKRDAGAKPWISKSGKRSLLKQPRCGEALVVHEFGFHSGDQSGGMGLIHEALHGGPSSGPIVHCVVVHVHADEGVGPGAVHAPRVPLRVLECGRAMRQPVHDARAQVARHLLDQRLAQVLADNVAA